jgi:excisionase family DNA binding protein
MTITEPASLQPLLCRIPLAAATLGHGERFIYEKIATGEIEAVKSGRRTLVVVASLQRYAAALPPAKIKPITRRAPISHRRRRPAAAPTVHQPTK